MTFFSIKFFLFLLLVFIVYYIIPAKYRYIWLLTASYFFYASWSVKYAAVLCCITIISYLSAQLMAKMNKKLCLYAGIAVSLMILIVFKFWNFWFWGLYTLFGITDPRSGGIISITAPVGLSFFILEAIGYMIDVYKGKFECETNIGRYALFLSFFPTILSGPIERSTNLLRQIQETCGFTYEKAKRGLILILEGGCFKLLVANRLSLIVNAAFEAPSEQTGATMMIAVILYSIQLYTDFAGYTYIALGIGNLFGFSLIENFKQPYFARTIKDFWGRWHISLSSWLKDYIYIPLGGNRKGKCRQYINLMITFLVSGIWHGTGWQFVIWGMIHGLYQIAAKITAPFRAFLSDKIKVNRECFSYRLLQMVITFGFVDFAWLFFRSSSVHEGLSICKNILLNFQIGNTLSNKLYLAGYDEGRFILLLSEILILLAVDILHENKISITRLLNRQNKLFRWMVYMILCMALVIGVIYDYGVDASTFIYTRF